MNHPRIQRLLSFSLLQLLHLINASHVLSSRSQFKYGVEVAVIREAVEKEEER
jgi:hypothetical protein